MKYFEKINSLPVIVDMLPNINLKDTYVFVTDTNYFAVESVLPGYGLFYLLSTYFMDGHSVTWPNIVVVLAGNLSNLL